jgi:hypothetical protein
MKNPNPKGRAKELGKNNFETGPYTLRKRQKHNPVCIQGYVRQIISWLVKSVNSIAHDGARSSGNVTGIPRQFFEIGKNIDKVRVGIASIVNRHYNL